MMARTSLPPGFRFHPTDVELVMYHLKRKVTGKNFPFEVISELNICNYSPWDLPDKSCLRSKDQEWYFFCPKEIRYPNGSRMKRSTECGYWKSTGKDRLVSYNDRTVAMVKTLVFHKGNAPKGERTDWVMYEYRMVDKELSDAGVVQDAYVLCKVFHKNGPGPKNGAQYGAPFKEEDYDDNGEIRAESLLPVALPTSALPSNDSFLHPGSPSSGPLGGGSVLCHGSTSSGPLGGSVIFPGSTSSGPLPDSTFVPGSTSSGPLSDPGLSKAILGADEISLPIVDNSDDIGTMLDMLIPHNEVENSEHANQNQNVGLASSNVNDIFDGLGDLTSWEETERGLTARLAFNDSAYMELDDLRDPLCFPAEYPGSEHIFTDSLWGP
ncbi:hypothetical protein Vadar_022870 [Vaccinium darrowii]|uniref:Uncharacterized protein n=1 Tax=Vaccinium darrowii TaxID=229202 RepID=A0ACB7YFW7_9ERIC|nr:hypothetical protein Vadar_022870 [Vaccinium darrowii]